MGSFWGHLRTICHHKRLVARHCFKVGLYRQGLTHDLSKFAPVEFIPGVKYFRGYRSPNEIERLETTTQKIIGVVVEKPEKLSQISRFLNYYLPTTLKLLNAYDRMDAAGVSGINIDGTKGKIEDMMETICKAFDKQLDALFGDEALDISADITVLEQMLQQEGLGDTPFQSPGS